LLRTRARDAEQRLQVVLGQRRGDLAPRTGGTSPRPVGRQSASRC
jgi:hypothetical protein